VSTVVGDAGFGKSALAAALGQHLEAMAPAVSALIFRAKEVLGGAAAETTRDLFRRVLDLPTVAPPDAGRALLGERLGAELGREVWAGVAVTMGWASTDSAEIRSLGAAPGALRAAAARAAGEGLRIAARRRPVALILEDAHLADEAALDALEYATLEEAACPIWVCVLGRPSFGRGRTAWASRAARHQQVTLPALEPAAAAELARRLLAPADNVSQSALGRLVERSFHTTSGYGLSGTAPSGNLGREAPSSWIRWRPCGSRSVTPRPRPWWRSPSESPPPS